MGRISRHRQPCEAKETLEEENAAASLRSDSSGDYESVKRFVRSRSEQDGLVYVLLMAKETHLFTNDRPLTLHANVGGNGAKPTSFREHELSYDADGLVHSISMTFNDGVVGNFVLIPKHKSLHQISAAIATKIGPLGLEIAAGKLMKMHPKLRNQSEEVHSLGKFIARLGGRIAIPNLFEFWALKDSAYFEVTSNELVISEPLWLPKGASR